MTDPIRFGRYELHPGERRLTCGGQAVALGARAFDVLAALVQRRDRVVGKDELLDLVWPDLVVEENNLQVQISALRKLLGPQVIATIPGRGYKFTALPGTDTEAPPPVDAAAPRSRTNLPPRRPVLLGRDDDVRAVCALLPEHELVSVVGPGGIGKTRVAQAVAHELHDAFVDGVWWVDLSAVTEPAVVVRAVAQVLGIGMSSGRSVEGALASVLASQRVLLVLDNCEQVLGAVVELLSMLLPACPGVRCLVTSQEVLRLPGEQVFRLDGLRVPAADEPASDAAGAVALFIERAQAVDARVRYDAAQLQKIAAICRALDGIPLAIELAAARAPLMGLDALRARLDERFRLLTGGARLVLPRHQTLRAALEWSHGLLDDEERAVLRRLGVFAGGFSLELAQEVASDQRLDRWRVLDLLGHLVDKSLVAIDQAEVPRYRLLETTRAFALEQLAAGGETHAMLRRHAETMLATVRPAEPRFWTALLDADRPHMGELDNLRAALEWASAATDSADRQLGAELMTASERVWHYGHLLLEGIERCAKLLPLPADMPPSLQARFHLVHGRLGYFGSRLDCFEAAGRAAELFRQLGDGAQLADALIVRVIIGSQRGALDAVGQELAEAESLLTPESPPRQRATLALAQTLWHFGQGNDEEILKAGQRQIECHRAAGADIGVQIATVNLALYEALLGRPDDAVKRMLGIPAVRSRNQWRGVGWADEVLAVAYAMRGGPGDLADAIRVARAAWPVSQRGRRDRNMLAAFALAFSRQGEAERAATLLGHARAVWAEEGTAEWPYQTALCEQVLATVRAALGTVRTEELLAAGARLNDERAAELAFGGPVGSR